MSTAELLSDLDEAARSSRHSGAWSGRLFRRAATAIREMQAAHDRRVTELLEANNREVFRRRDLHEALRFALHRLIRFEPGDSRAVSDEFVAMAAIEAGPAVVGDHGASLTILREALAREQSEDPACAI